MFITVIGKVAKFDIMFVHAQAYFTLVILHESVLGLCEISSYRNQTLRQAHVRVFVQVQPFTLPL